MVNKKAWIKLLEAFMAISLVIVILSLSFYNVSKKNTDVKDLIEEKEFETLNMIQTNDTLRESIFNVNVSLIPIESNQSGFPDDVNSFWNSTIINSIECKLKICLADSICELTTYPNNKEIYVKSVIISATREQFSPKTLASFCWEKG